MVVDIIILVYIEEMVIDPECFPQKSVLCISCHPNVTELGASSRLLTSIVDYLVIHAFCELEVCWPEI